MPDGGYEASADAMANAQVALSNAADGTTSQADKVGPTSLTQPEFGRVHGEYFADYKSGVDTMAASMKGLAGALTSLSGGVGSASKVYSAGDADQAEAAKKAGKG